MLEVKFEEIPFEDVLYWYRGRVDKIIDGDSYRISLDLGFGLVRASLKMSGEIIGENYRVHGINTPEIRGEEREEGLKSKARVESLLKPGDSVLVRTSKSGKYGRYLADVYLIDGEGNIGQSIGNLLIEEGYAKEYEP